MDELDRHGVYLFTYVDGDDFIAEHEKRARTSSEVPPHAIAEAMTKFPDRSAHKTPAASKAQDLIHRESICQVLWTKCAENELVSSMMVFQLLDGATTFFLRSCTLWQR